MAESNATKPMGAPVQQFSVMLQNEAGALESLLRPFSSDSMVADPVTTYVNNARNDGPLCIRVQRELF